MGKKPEPREKAKKGWNTKLAHPSYVIEPCPNCDFPEADGGYCEECGWSRPDPRGFLWPKEPTR